MVSVNLENVNEASNSTRYPDGAYVCRITGVENVPLNGNTGKGNYLRVHFDIAEGEHKDYYKNLLADHPDWKNIDSYIRSYKEAALPMFKRFCNRVSESNPNYVFDGGKTNGDETTLVGKLVGLVIGTEQYYGNDGNVKTRPYVDTEISVSDVRAGKFTMPKLKEVPSSSSTNADNSFVQVPETDAAELPF